MNDIIAGPDATTPEAVDDGLTFPGDVIVRYANGGGVRHHFDTRDEYNTWTEGETGPDGKYYPRDNTQILAVEQA